MGRSIVKKNEKTSFDKNIKTLKYKISSKYSFYDNIKDWLRDLSVFMRR